MNETHDVQSNENELEVVIRTGIQAGDDGGYIGSGVGKDGGGTIGSGT